MAILRRVVNGKNAALSEEGARAILGLDFDQADRKRINDLAAKNRAGQLTAAEEEELDHFIHVGQLLGILKSKARQALKKRSS
jgi:hypothetical protein